MDGSADGRSEDGQRWCSFHPGISAYDRPSTSYTTTEPERISSSRSGPPSTSSCGNAWATTFRGSHRRRPALSAIVQSATKSKRARGVSAAIDSDSKKAGLIVRILATAGGLLDRPEVFEADIAAGHALDLNRPRHGRLCVAVQVRVKRRPTNPECSSQVLKGSAGFDRPRADPFLCRGSVFCLHHAEQVTFFRKLWEAASHFFGKR